MMYFFFYEFVYFKKNINLRIYIINYMNKKILVFVVILIITSITFVSAQSNDSVKSAFDQSTVDFLTLEKEWVGDNESVRPDSITVDVLADGQLLETVSISKSNNWKYNGRSLFPINDTDGNEVKYTFKEHGADDYTLTFVKNGVLDYTLKNTYNGNSNTQNNNTQTNNNQSNSDNSHSNSASGNSSGSSNHHTHNKHDSNKHSSGDSKVDKKPHNHTQKNITNEMKKTGNAIWAVVICIIVIAAVVVYKRR